MGDQIFFDNARYCSVNPTEMSETVIQNNDVVDTVITYCISPDCNDEPGETSDFQSYDFTTNQTVDLELGDETTQLKKYEISLLAKADIPVTKVVSEFGENCYRMAITKNENIISCKVFNYYETEVDFLYRNLTLLPRQLPIQTGMDYARETTLV